MSGGKKIHIGEMLEHLEEVVGGLSGDMATMSSDMAGMVAEMRAVKDEIINVAANTSQSIDHIKVESGELFNVAIRNDELPSLNWNGKVSSLSNTGSSSLGLEKWFLYMNSATSGKVFNGYLTVSEFVSNAVGVVNFELTANLPIIFTHEKSSTTYTVNYSVILTDENAVDTELFNGSGASIPNGTTSKTVTINAGTSTAATVSTGKYKIRLKFSISASSSGNFTPMVSGTIPQDVVCTKYNLSNIVNGGAFVSV